MSRAASAASKSIMLPRAWPDFGARDHQQRVEGLDQRIQFLDRGFERRAIIGLSLLEVRSASSARLRSRVSGVFRSCAILSETSFRPRISASIRSSISFRLCASRSSSSPLPATGSRPGQVAAHDGAGGLGHGVDAAQHPPRDEEAADQSEHDDGRGRPFAGIEHDVDRAGRALRDRARPEA